ncbi:MFS transporter [Micropruina sonneratiae]|uniref:MFS transporter n=1 Tax=Micropruina sonneratiae TaxID=2986940 RepID=UPI00222780AE|nr:MFS transporter [Micropruina sp. KQZ13P-5]MCW3158416.1 MFS transporter [Micropruina sp. KQZ13P-5]
MSAATLDRVPMFSSFGIRNYRLFWTGGFISNIGTWMSRIAQDWLVLTILTAGSATALGLTTALQFLPVAVLAPYAGSLADRFSKRRVLMVTQAFQAAIGLSLAGLVIGGVVQLWHVYLLATLLGVSAAFDGPARQAMAPEMVPNELIPNAVGLNTTSFHSARLIGPAVAGLTIAWWGVGPALLFNGLSFVAVLIALAMMDESQLTPSPRAQAKGSVRAGLQYVRSRPDIMLLMFLVFMLGTFGLNFQVTNALMATKVFGVGAESYGILSSIMAIGSLAAGLAAARRTRLRLRLIVGALAAFSLACLLLALVPSYTWFAVLLIPAGFTSLTVMTAANASVQLATTPVMRGRVMALYQAIFLGGTPLGAPVIGWVGDVWGPRWTLVIGGVMCGLAVLVAVVYVVRKVGWQALPWRHRRTIYVPMEDFEDAR